MQCWSKSTRTCCRIGRHRGHGFSVSWVHSVASSATRQKLLPIRDQSARSSMEATRAWQLLSTLLTTKLAFRPTDQSLRPRAEASASHQVALYKLEHCWNCARSVLPDGEGSQREVSHRIKPQPCCAPVHHGPRCLVPMSQLRYSVTNKHKAQRRALHALSGGSRMTVSADKPWNHWRVAGPLHFPVRQHACRQTGQISLRLS